MVIDMKEQIQKFIKQAGTDTSGKWMGIDNAEKFAELIIRECANVAMQADIDGCNIGNRAWQKINEHFGVK
jgi:hypothetical protein